MYAYVVSKINVRKTKIRTKLITVRMRIYVAIIIIIKTIFHQGAQLTNSDFQRGPELDKVLSK